MFSNKRDEVEIDHMRLDVMVVEEGTEKVFKPWLTAAVHLGTGYVLGTHLSLGAPNLKSTEFSRKIEEEFGPITWHVRCPRNPHYYGTVERFFCTLNRMLFHSPESCESTMDEIRERIDQYVKDVNQSKTAFKKDEVGV